MTNASYVTQTFEREKNIKASVYTAVICVLLLIIFFFAQWTLPQIPPPVVDEGIEVNLGNSETGLGDEAPMIPKPASASDKTNYNPPPVSRPQVQNQPNITADENETDDVPAVAKVEKHVVKNTPVEKEVIKPIAKPTPAAVIPTPKPPSPKAVYKGGTSTDGGGNNADTYNNSRNQGIAGGKGDQGSPNGNPNSDSYKGNGGNGQSGVRIRSGLDGRRFTRLPSFQDDFNENAKVAVDIKVDRNGNVTSALINPRGTTTTNAGIKAIALRKALQLKLNAGNEDEQTGTLIFDFKLNG